MQFPELYNRTLLIIQGKLYKLSNQKKMFKGFHREACANESPHNSVVHGTNNPDLYLFSSVGYMSSI